MSVTLVYGPMAEEITQTGEGSTDKPRGLAFHPQRAPAPVSTVGAAMADFGSYCVRTHVVGVG